MAAAHAAGRPDLGLPPAGGTAPSGRPPARATASCWARVTSGFWRSTGPSSLPQMTAALEDNSVL